MNLTYFRKSTQSADLTFADLKAALTDNGWDILGSKKDDKEENFFISFCKEEVFKKAMDKDNNLMAFLPCSAIVSKSVDGVKVGTVSTHLLSTLSQDEEIHALSHKLQAELEEIVNKAAKVGVLKPQKVKLYSTMSCPYCKMEESWLKENKVDYEVVHVDLNQQEAEKMVEKTGQMGVPVTEIEFEDAESQFVIGFDKHQLLDILKL